jgi:hypothetical protein
MRAEAEAMLRYGTFERDVMGRPPSDLDEYLEEEGISPIAAQGRNLLQPLSPLSNWVAVGTALAGGPPHGSVREELPHTALTSGR